MSNSTSQQKTAKKGNEVESEELGGPVGQLVKVSAIMARCDVGVVDDGWHRVNCQRLPRCLWNIAHNTTSLRPGIGLKRK